jgi:hypothetical protein
MVTDATYCGQRPDQGRLAPFDFPAEGAATLVCGGTAVRLSYSALGLISGWLSVGSRGYDQTAISGAIIQAVNAVTCEASLGRTSRLDELQDFADHVAILLTDDELCGDMSGDDAVDTIGSLVSWARRLSDHRPPERKNQESPDAQS